MLLPLFPVPLEATLRVEHQQGVGPGHVGRLPPFGRQAIVLAGLVGSGASGDALLWLRGFFFSCQLHPPELLQPVEVHQEAVVAALGELVGDAVEVELLPLGDLLRVDGPVLRLSPGLLFSDRCVQGKGPMQRDLVVVEDVCLRGTTLGVYLR